MVRYTNKLGNYVYFKILNLNSSQGFKTLKTRNFNNYASMYTL